MNKEEIIKTLQANDSTILSFKDRGPWGDNKYRGNCSGYIQAFLVWKYHVNYLSELFAGSGTGSDVARDMGIDYFGMDLNPRPVRNNIITFDCLFLIFSHGNVKRIFIYFSKFYRFSISR